MQSSFGQSSLKARLAPVFALAARLAGRTALLAAGLGVVFCMLGFQWLQARLGAPMLDMMGPYQRDELVERMLLYGESGRVLHARFTLFLDMLFPLVYGGFFAGLISLASRHIRYGAGGVFAVIAVMLVDWAENLQLLTLLWGFPDLSDAQIAAASATTQAKVLAIEFAFLWLAGLVFVQLWRRLKQLGRG